MKQFQDLTDGFWEILPMKRTKIAFGAETVKIWLPSS